MAKLARLNIMGIRNFGPKEDDLATIKFFSPVTLFLGQNGCGKTTIIECLRYACTGDLPKGSTNGQTFIHDPKITGTALTKGQVRLKFFDVNGKEFTIIRTAQLEQNRDKAKFKVLDATLTYKLPDGTFQQLPGRCNDISKQCCDIMGVADAILNYVIFCHQEESLWPLDEGKSVKEKFDKIFDVDNYTKCVDSLRNLKKNITKQLKDSESGLQSKKKYKETFEADRDNLQRKKKESEKIEEKIKNIEAQKDLILTKLRVLNEKKEHYDKLQQKLNEFETDKKILLEKQGSLKKFIGEEFEGSDEDLKEAIESFYKNFDEAKTKIDQLERQKNRLLQESEDLEKAIKKKSVKLGELKNMNEEHEKDVLKRSDSFKKCTSALEINLNHEELEAQDIMYLIQQALSEEKEKLEITNKENKKEEMLIQKKIDQMRESVISKENDIKNREQQIEKCKTTREKIRRDLQDTDDSVQEMQTLQSKTQRYKNELNNLQAKYNEKELSNEIKSEQHKIHTLKRTMEDLKDEYEILKQNTLIEHDINKHKQNVKKFESDLNKLKTKHGNKLKTLFGENIINQNFTQNVLDKNKNFTQSIKEINDLIATKNNEVTKLKTEKNMQEKELEKNRQKLKDNQTYIGDVCKGKSYTTLLNELTEDIKKLQKSQGQVSSAKVMYETFTEQFESEKPCCPICKTNFESKKETVKNIVTSLRSQIQDAPQKLTKIEKTLQQKQELREKVLLLKPLNDEIEELTDFKIPFCVDEIETINNNLKAKKDEINMLTKKLETPQLMLNICNELTADCYTIDGLITQIKKEKNSVETLKLDIKTVPSKKTREEVEIDIEETRKTIELSETNRDTKQQVLIKNQQQEQKLKEQLNNVERRLLDIEKTQGRRPQLEEQMAELKNTETKLLDEIKTLETYYKTESTQLKEAETKKEKLMQNNEALIKKLRENYSKNEILILDTEKLHKSIENYIKSNKAGEFKAAQNELYKLSTENDNVNSKIKNMEKELFEQQDLLKNKNDNLQKLKDNQTFRSNKIKLEELNEKLTNLEKDISSIDIRKIRAENDKIEDNYRSLNNEQQQMNGSKSELDKEIKNLDAKINSTECENAFADYKRSWFQREVHLRALNDLERATVTLETSIIKFHEEKMQQINQILREYWMQIYRGNDIDYISIKTEMATMGGATKRRVYNYRVVQMKNGVELDMRGRCSAGQKVLACLIIRMALAETFSSNCGILALDEPTTNLDKDNISSLSEALASIIESRQKEKNFQLLVITHDEEFLQTLMQVEKLPYYYRVQRNQEGNSIINRETL